VEARALVTRRIRPLLVDGRTIHQVAMPFHWGPTGPNRGDVVNDLVPLSGEPNVTIHEGKAMVCAVLPGRRPPDAELDTWLEQTFGADVATARARPEEEGGPVSGEDGGYDVGGRPAGGGLGREGKA
ncbi:MAG: hypothetical protein ABR527_04460, partial [Gemmatimonadota bacterium]